ncbi:MAG: M48 family metallopeptidase [Kangiellaceae bacterium]|nr:M48 family metallopeptidase [Kangiellaceae bacterium]
MKKNFLALKLIILSCISCFTLGFAAQSHAATDLPKIGEAAGSTLSVAKEQIIGDEIMAQIRRSEYLVKDPLITDYIQQLGHRLVAANPDALGRRFQFFVIQEDSINAFALPGGYIGIHTGLITASQSESELASVLGHEVAHVTQRHLARRLEKQGQLSLPVILGMIGSVIAATQDPEAGMAGVAATQAAAQQSIINHTRENEQEADRIGVAMLSSAGFDARDAANFFETLQQASRYTKKPPEILLTHPLSRNRIAATRSRAEMYPEIEHQSSMDYQLIKARVESQSKTHDNNYFINLRDKHRNGKLNRLSEQYQYAELLKSRALHIQSTAILEQLYAQNPNNQVLLFSLAEVQLAQDNNKKILPLLLEQLDKTPGSSKLINITAQVYLNMDDAKSAEKLLLRYADVNKNNPSYLYTLAQAQSKAGHIPEMHETTGQYLLLLGDLRTAKKHFELALNRTSEDPYAQTRIQARLDEVRQRLREQLQKKSDLRLSIN